MKHDTLGTLTARIKLWLGLQICMGYLAFPVLSPEVRSIS